MNNAGIIRLGPLEDIPIRDWIRTVEVNLNGVYFPMRVFGSRMLKEGRGVIINVASVAGEIPLPGAGAYSPTKAAVIMLTRQAAMEWGPRGVRVNAICPGPIMTDLLLSEFSEEELEARKGIMPLRRLGLPEDVARLATYLASDDSSYVTGSCFPIDGGLGSSTYLIMKELLRERLRSR